MGNKSYPGEFEQMVLLAVLRIGEEAYAVPVRGEIETRFDGLYIYLDAVW